MSRSFADEDSLVPSPLFPGAADHPILPQKGTTHTTRWTGGRGGEQTNFRSVGMDIWIYTTSVLLVFVPTAWANEKGAAEQRFLKHLFLNYDKRVMPAKYGPVFVDYRMDVISLIELNADKNLYTITISFRQQWYDERLTFPSYRYGPFVRPDLDNIWIPDLFFEDAFKGSLHRTLAPDTEVRIYSDGKVHCSSRVSIDVYWPMDLTNFPMDKQVLEMGIITHEHRAHDISIEVRSWKTNPIQISKIFHFPPFTVSSMAVYPCTKKTNTSSTVESNCLKIMIHFTRDFTYYLLRAFVPTISLVILSWIPFWLNPRCMAPRLSMAIVSLAILVCLAVAESGPRVFYLKAMDIWMGSCFCFILCVFIEVVIASSSIFKEAERSKELDTKDVEEICVIEPTKNNNCLLPKYTFIPPNKPGENKHSAQAQKIDVVSRFLFPVAFGIFNLAFWIFYTVK